MPWSSGMWLGILAKLGHVASSNTDMHWPPVTVWTLYTVSNRK